MTMIRAMCAIGLRGQLGLGGHMPWEGATGPEFVADVARFFAATEGHVLIGGPKTMASIPDFLRPDRTIQVVRSSTRPEDAIAAFPGRVIYICGGPPMWAAYAHLVTHWDITRLPYDGEADRWFDPAWLVASPGRAAGG